MLLNEYAGVLLTVISANLKSGIASKLEMMAGITTVSLFVQEDSLVRDVSIVWSAIDRHVQLSREPCRRIR